ncbi:hypothetical protein LEP1GSC049_3605 [Leptospira kirschneri serovar Cynopteri str. 3522 CT]|nr:hypothetical protein LEP1GSC049_3605 [Leptospira kirschneri serovar Cynopteri str. 3522 CT]
MEISFNPSFLLIIFAVISTNKIALHMFGVKNEKEFFKSSSYNF